MPDICPITPVSLSDPAGEQPLIWSNFLLAK